MHATRWFPSLRGSFRHGLEQSVRLACSGRLNARVIISLFATAFGITACQAPSRESSRFVVPLDSVGIRASIDSFGAKVMRANATGDAKLFAETWATDGIMSAPGMPPIHGRDSIVASFRRRAPLPPGAVMTINPTELQILSANWAYVFGVDSLILTPQGATVPVTETSTFLVLLRKGPDGWQNYREVLSANQLHRR